MSKEIPRSFWNSELLSIIKEYLEANPDMRFSQALLNLSFVVEDKENSQHTMKDEYYLESSKLHKRVLEAMERKNEHKE